MVSLTDGMPVSQYIFLIDFLFRIAQNKALFYRRSFQVFFMLPQPIAREQHIARGDFETRICLLTLSLAKPT